MSNEHDQTPAEQAPPEKPQLGLLSLPISVLTMLIGPLTLQNLFQWVKVIAIAVGITLVLRWCAFEPYKIPSGSMIPTLQIDDRILVNKWAYGLRIPFTKIRLWHGRAPKRWEVVVFKNVKEDAEHPVLVKRVVALPNERVHIQDGRIFINDKPLELPDGMPPVFYTSSYDMRYGTRPEDEFSIVPEGHYLMLGDNSGQSSDGRYFGWLPEENMLGPVVAIWWPRIHARDFSGFTHTWWWRGTIGLIALYIFMTMFVVRTWKVHGTGLGGLLQSGDRIVVNLVSFGPAIPFTTTRLFSVRRPMRGELVVYAVENENDGASHLHIGRVAAFGSETIALEDGRLLIDGLPLVDPNSLVEHAAAIRVAATDDASQPKPVHVPAGHVFILSDEIDEGMDSRQLGPVPANAIIGPVTRIVWPLARWKQIRP